MTLAAIDWLSISINLLLIVFVIVCLLMTLLILMQRPKQEGLGAAFGGGVTDQVFGARTTNVLQRGTVYLGTLFFVLALLLAILIGRQNPESGLAKKEEPAVVQLKENTESEEGVEGGEGDQPSALEPESESDEPASLLDELSEETNTDAESPSDSPDESTEATEEDADSEEVSDIETAPEAEVESNDTQEPSSERNEDSDEASEE